METVVAPQDPRRSRSSAAPAHQEFITHPERGPGRNHGHGVEYNTPPGDSEDYADCPAFGRGNGARNFWTSPPPPPGDPRCWMPPVRGGPGRALLPTLFQAGPRFFPMSEQSPFPVTPPWRGYRGGPPPMPPWNGPRPWPAIRFSHEQGNRGAFRGRPPFRRGGQSCHNLNAPHMPYLKQDTPTNDQAPDGCPAAPLLEGHASHSSQPNSGMPCGIREVPHHGQDTLASGAVNRRRSRGMTHVGEERSSEVPRRRSARSLSRAAMLERKNQVPCAEVSSTSGKCVEQRWKLPQRSSKRIEESEKRRQNSSRNSRAKKRASGVAAGYRRRMNSKALKGTPARGRAAAPSDGHSVSTIRKSKEHMPTDSANGKEHRRVSVARNTKHAEGRPARPKAQGKRSLTKSRSNNCEREKTSECVGRFGISATPLCNEDIPPLPTAEQTTQMVLATGQYYGKGPAPPNGASDCIELGSPSAEKAQLDEDGNRQGFDILANVWWAQPYSSAAQDDSDIFMEPFFSEDWSYTEPDDAAVTTDAEKAAAASDPSSVGSEGRQDEVALTSGARRGDVASESSTGGAESAFSASPIDALRGEAPNSASIVQQWLESSFAGPSGHCGIPEAAQPRDQLETAHASDVRKSQEDVTDPAMSCGGPQVHPTFGPDSGGDMSSTVPIKTEITDGDISGQHGSPGQPCTAAAGQRVKNSVGQQEKGNSTPDGTPQSHAANGAPFSQEEVMFELKAYNAMRLMELCSDQEGKDRVWELYASSRATKTMESAAEEMRRLARATVERRRVKWKGVTPALRKLANQEWTMTPTGTRIKGLIKARADAEGGCSKT